MANIKRALTSGITKTGTAVADVPDAPTIGVATAAGLAASVTFTPAVTGGTPTSFTVTSSPGGFTGTGASAPITVSGLTADTSYTFTVTATNAAGTSPASSASNSITAVLPMEGAYDSLATATIPSGGLTSVVFAGIPSGYKSLQIRGVFRGTSGSQNAGYLRLNGDTGTNYNFHQFFGNGASALSNGDVNSTWMYFQKVPGSSDLANVFGSAIIDILDYSSTTKNKVMRYIGGDSLNGSGFAFLGSSTWFNTSTPVNTISISIDGSDWAEFSTFTLYGVK